MEKGAFDLLMIVLEQELAECEKTKVVKSRKEYNHKYYLEKTKKKRIAQKNAQISSQSGEEYSIKKLLGDE